MYSSFESEVYMHNPHITPEELEAHSIEHFRTWFEKRVRQENKFGRFEDVIEGPINLVNSYPACIVNGYRFNIDDVSEPTSVNSGVVVLGSCYKDSTESNYYGRLKEVIVLNYPRGKQVVTFKCNWFDNTDKGVQVDKNGVVTVNVKSKYKKADVFILASQATQVYYAPPVVKNSKTANWYSVITTKTRAFDGTNITPSDEALQEVASNPVRVLINVDEMENIDELLILDEDNDEDVENDDIHEFIVVDEDVEEELVDEEDEEDESDSEDEYD